MTSYPTKSSDFSIDLDNVKTPLDSIKQKYYQVN